MEVICLEDKAFYALIQEVVERIKEKQSTTEDFWIDTETAMKLLGIKSKTSLQDLRNNGKIRFSQPQKKIILYDKRSILEYLDKNAQETF